MQHFATLDAAARMRSDIKDNNRRIKRISKRIRKDKSEEMYGLEEFDSRMKEVRDNIKDIESQKRRHYKSLNKQLNLILLQNLKR